MASEKVGDAAIAEAETELVADNRATRGPLEKTLEATSTYSPSDELASALTARQRAIAALGAAGLKTLSKDAFVIDSEVDRGGMGRVLLAADQRLGRAVALKQLLPGGGTRQARFIREMLITARLQHPNIVPIYEAGRWEGHGLVYSMRKVEGQSLRERLLKTEDLESRLALLPNLIAACDAIAYAHSEGIVHRDIKPANMILGDFGETVVIDWGLAKAIDEEQAVDAITGSKQKPVTEKEALIGSDLTAFGSVVGTPRYMSPEQAAGDIVDTATDVYSLGACLYELLTGRPPYADERSELVLDAVVTSGPASPEDLADDLPRELVAICRLAMARDADRRYSARDLADELRRYQAGALVGAHEYTPTELVLRWLRRNRMAVAVGVVAAVALTALAVTSAIRLYAEKQRTQAALEESLERNDELLIAEAQRMADSDPLAALERLDALSDDSAEWASARAIATVAERRGIPDALVQLPTRATRLDAIGDTLLAFGDRIAWRIDPESAATEQLELPEDFQHERPGRVIGFEEGHAVAVDLVAGTRKRLAPMAERPAVWATSHDERFVAWGSARGIVVLDRETGKEMVVDEREPVSMSFSPTGWQLAAIAIEPSNKAHTALLIEPNKGVVRPIPDQKPADNTTVTWSPDGELVYLRFGGGFVVGFRFGEGPISMSRSPELVAPVATHANGLFAVATLDRRVIVHKRGSHRVRLEVRGLVHNMEFAPKGGSIAIAGAEGQLYHWSYLSNASHYYPHQRPVLDVAFNPAGNVLYSLATDRWIRRFRTARRESSELEPLNPLKSRPGIGTRRSAVLDHGHVIGFDNGQLIHYDTRAKSRRAVGALPGDPREYRISSSGEWVALADGTELRLWSPQKSTSIAVHAVDAPITAMAFDTDERHLITGHADGSLWRWVPADGTRVRIDSPPLEGAPRALAAHTDGAVAVATEDSEAITILEVGTARTLAGHGGAINGLAFTRDGSRIASIADDLDLRLWFRADGSSRRIGSHPSVPTVVTFSPDGRSIATLAGEDTFLWDVATGLGQAVVSVPYDVTAARFHENGRELFLSNGYVLFSTTDDLPRDADGLRAWIRERLAANPRPTE